MSQAEKIPNCEYCGAQMKKWEFPPNSGWDGEYHFVCFNDECDYFVRGWNWMLEKYQVKSSYRNRIDPIKGKAFPLPVWSKDAMKDKIIS